MASYPDYHVHTYLCGHATGTAEEYVLQASAQGLPEIGFAEHIPMYWLPESERDPTIAMRADQLPQYVQTVLALRAAHSDVTVRLGVEADFIPGHEERLAEILQRYPWDYVYGSVHYVDGWGFDNPEYRARYDEWDLDELYERYFDLVCQAATSGLFDVLGHLDVIKKWGHVPAVPPTGLYERVADTVTRAGVAVEVSSAGYRKPVGQPYPWGELLEKLVERQVPLTLGSDAHAPAEVGYRLGDLVGELRLLGCRA
ncbi:MAG: histidinol-phosphatase HisJ family protein, partial [Chloroflexota bacterium]|nr:histidinol-phosphatase HisJ family protein [Chloroflexota bacterium]